MAGAEYYDKKCMKENKREPADESLGKLLRAVRPTPELSAGFQAAVWRRIERGEQTSPGILERLAAWLLTPRFATAGLAAVVLLAGALGAMRGIQTGEREARDRYMASVDPSYLQK